MDLEDLFKNKKQGHRKSYNDYRGSHGHHNDMEKYLKMFQMLTKNKKLLAVVIAGAFILVVVIIILLILLFPLLVKLFEAIQKNGIKGIFDSIQPLLDTLWNGTGK